MSSHPLRPLPAPAHAGLRGLAWARWRMLRAAGISLLHAPLKLSVVLTGWLLLLGGFYLLAREGVAFLYRAAGIGPFLLDRLWYLFLFVLAIMLVVSQLASAYSTFVRAPETRWWMTLPVDARTLCRAKWIESSCYSAWAAVLFLLPLSLAYFHVMRRPLWLMGWVGALVVPLAAILTACATSVLLIWLRWCGRIAIRREVIAVGFVAACAGLFWALGEQRRAEEQNVWFLALQELLPRMQVAMSPWLPSQWAARALSATVNGRWAEGTVYASLLWMTALVAWRALDHLGAFLLLPVLRIAGRPFAGVGPRAMPHAGRMPMAWWMRSPLRASLVKDWLLIVRDPMQWTQGVVFFGLLGAYFANIHRLTQVGLDPAWRIGIASLNLACTLLVFGALAVRFLFPQMSLEGRSLWLVRVAPAGLRWLLGAKLLLYGVMAAALIDGLLWVSASRLGIPLAIRWWLAGVGVLAGLTIVGLTVGMGAWWVDPTAQDAARIVSSSRGALVLVAMLAYVGSVVAALVVAWAGWAMGLRERVAFASAALVVVSLLTGALPVRFGLSKLERLESASASRGD